nr:hypothetical protein [Tanacetum cinerariifolium]
DVCGPFKIVSRQGASYFVTFTDDFSRYSYVYLLKHKHEVFETFKVFQKEIENQLGKTIKSLRSDRGDLKASGSVEDLDLIQKEDTNPSVDTSLNHEEDDQENDEPQSDINPIRKYSRTRRAPDRMCLYIDAEEHELGDLGEPANYKAALLDPESKKWLDAMNVEMQSMKDNDVWVLVELPPNAETVRSKWLFKKKTDMDGNMERELRVSCYTDAGYLMDAENLKSQTGYVFVLNGGVVDWKSTKQSIFATSSTDAEYVAAFDASKEAVWIRKFISGLGIVPTIKEPISMYCDNTGAITIAKDDGVTKGARHFRAKVHYLRKTIKLCDVKIEKIHIDDNLADPFTKALAFPKHSELTRNIGLLPASSFM